MKIMRLMTGYLIRNESRNVNFITIFKVQIEFGLLAAVR